MEEEIKEVATNKIKPPSLLPSKIFVNIEFPGVIQNVENALTCLGGREALAQELSENSKNLEIRFRPDDITSRPIIGDKVNDNLVLIKVSKKRKRATGETEISSEVVGTISETYKFQRMADFQVFQRREFGSDKEPFGLDFPAPIFSKYYTSNSSFIQNLKEPKQISYVISVKFTETEGIPEAPLSNERLKHYDLVKKLFDERPMWSNLLLKKKINDHAWKNITAQVAYYITTGPWRHCWAKYGYDPRKLPESKIYQIITFKLKEKKGNTTETESQEGPEFPYYQLCDIDDRNVQLIIEHAVLNPKPTYKTGWFSEITIQKIKQVLNFKLK